MRSRWTTAVVLAGMWVLSLVASATQSFPAATLWRGVRGPKPVIVQPQLVRCIKCDELKYWPPVTHSPSSEMAGAG